jgi:hypothetical protein
MATPTLPNGQEPTTILPPPADVNTWQPGNSKLIPWRRIATIICVPIITILTAIGGYTVINYLIPSPPAKSTTIRPSDRPHHTTPPKPSYDLPGFRTAITGSGKQTFVTALDQFTADSRRYDFQSVARDALSLSGAASTWLNMLKGTTPPPSYQASKLDYIMAAALGQRAAYTTKNAIRIADLASLQKGARLAARAKTELSQAIISAPRS